MKIKSLMKVLATWIGIALLVIAYMIDKRSIIFIIGVAAFIFFSCFCTRCTAESWRIMGEEAIG